MERINSNQLDKLYEKIKNGISGKVVNAGPQERYDKKNKIGVIGVTIRGNSFASYYYKKGKTKGKNTRLGTYPLLQDAVKARFVAELKWGVKQRGGTAEKWLIKEGYEKWVKKQRRTVKKEVEI